RNVVPRLREPVEELQPCRIGHPVIRYDQVHAAAAEDVECRLHVVDTDRLVSGALEQRLQDLHNGGLIVDAKDRCHRSPGIEGSTQRRWTATLGRSTFILEGAAAARSEEHTSELQAR